MKLLAFLALKALLLLTGCQHHSYHVSKPNVSVTADGETEVMAVEGDVADDPAIWVHPENSNLSLIIGTNKKGGGLDVYDLSGKRLQSLPDGKFNNVDLRQGMQIGAKSVTIVAATNRSDDSLALYGIDTQTRQLYPIAARTIPTMEKSYGTCMYHDLKRDRFYVFVNGKSGLYKQFELFESDGKVDAKVVRTFSVATQPEGCVADDETEMLYVGEENVAIWRYGADADADDMRVLIDSVDGGHLTADVEGLALYRMGKTEGYLIASSQGNNSYTVYDRISGAYLGAFNIIDGVFDGTSETDGIAATSLAVGKQYPHGMLVVQDDKDEPSRMQNFKLLRLEKALEKLQLPYRQ
jgi:3-phytase